MELRGTVGWSLVRARGELQEVPVERRCPLGLPGEACVDPDHGPEGRLDELDVTPRAVGPLHILLAGHLQAMPPARRITAARAPRYPTGAVAALPAEVVARRARGSRRSRLPGP